MLLWGTLKKTQYLQRGQQGPLTPSKPIPAPLPALSEAHLVLPSSCRGLCSPRQDWAPGLPWRCLSLENAAGPCRATLAP